ncbi:chromate efflux transporter [Adhaeribacter sp. BT258]|uniref:Chromate efflux transporter n=1 Tax=Adhaeribacter terrigena TaxID=2793070 RepID=A0ABS1C590_9BACT|nr:chromate efflux transporter [Adhaeribacter terrigena]
MAQIAMIREELVEEEKWVTPEKFNRVLAIYQVLPGPEAHELCVYFGMLAGGRLGGILAGLGFMLPGFIFMMLLTWLYVSIGIESPVLKAVFIGFQAAVIALIFAAVHRIGKHALINLRLLTIAAAAFIAYFCGVGFFIVLPLAGIAYSFWVKGNILLTALCGVALAIACFILFDLNVLQFQDGGAIDNSTSQAQNRSSLVVFWTGLKAGMLTFGGAYTVIPFIQQDAVMQNAWLTNRQFLDGIALSGILPAPLIIFSTFVGYFGAGWPGAVIMTFAIFLPAFVITLVGHNFMEKTISNKGLHSFLDGVTAGVIGLIAVTAIQLFRTTITDWFTFLVFALSLLVLYKIKSKFTVVFVILGAGLAGFLWFTVLKGM